MILILSFDIYEQGTDPVIEWLLYYKHPFIKISINDFLRKDTDCELNVITNELRVNGIVINHLIKVIWYRRFYYDYTLKSNKSDKFYDKLSEETSFELRKIFDHLGYIFRKCIWVPDFNSIEINKLTQIAYAKEVGLNLPETIITNSKKELISFSNLHNKNIITKPVSDGSRSYYFHEGFTYFAFTKKLTPQLIDDLPDYFFPSLFQQALESSYEVRVFVLGKQIYSTANLFDGKKENIDLKVYSNEFRMRNLTYKLPNDEKKKILRFMKLAKLNTGSFDFLKTIENKYYFLEVNPVGQYGSPSYQSNYYLEKEIANYLIQKENEYK